VVGVARNIEEFHALRAQQELDVVYIALPLNMHRQIERIVHDLRDTTATVLFVPDFSGYRPLRSTWSELGNMLAVSLVDSPHQGLDGALKRTVDMVFASTALLVLALPMLAIAAAVKLTSPGPAIFAQKRYGLDGKSFHIYKFRTMVAMEDGESTFTQACRGDTRVTRLGSFLRRTSLDELPQLFNVFVGDMSLVGPRPHPVALNESQRKLIDGYMLRHKVKPGITGLAQVNGLRGETDAPEKMQQRVRFDLEYINTWSLHLDARIMWRTLFVMFHDPNAY
jgi:putative colanic acid biosynthesis UDP-glucose lipid carrier transferase